MLQVTKLREHAGKTVCHMSLMLHTK